MTIHNTREEIANATPAIAVAPFASIHQHGPHLPLDTDAIILDAVSRGMAEKCREEVYLLPPIPAGQCPRYLDFGGTVSVHTDTLYAIVSDVVWSLRQHDIRKIVVINSLGQISGNSSLPAENMPMKVALRDMNIDHPEADHIWLQPAVAAQQTLREIFPGWQDDIVGGDFETSCIMHLAPDMVRGSAQDVVPEIMDSAMLTAVPFRKISPTGVWGHPTRATAEKGRQAVAAMIDATLAYMERTFDYLSQIKKRDRATTPPHH